MSETKRVIARNEQRRQALARGEELDLGDALALLKPHGVTFSLTEGLTLPADLSYEMYERVGWILGKLRDATAWAIGQWVLYGEGRWPDRVEQAALVTGRGEDTIRQYARVAGKVAPERRRPELSFSHHKAVAALEPREQKRLLDLAADRRLSVTEMSGHMVPRVVPEKPVVNSGRVVDLARRVLSEASSLPDGRFAVSGEVVAQLRTALGEDAA